MLSRSRWRVPTLVVGVHCSIDTLIERERGREGRRGGLAGVCLGDPLAVCQRMVGSGSRVVQRAGCSGCEAGHGGWWANSYQSRSVSISSCTSSTAPSVASWPMTEKAGTSDPDITRTR